jgi:hypothetical protein
MTPGWRRSPACDHPQPRRGVLDRHLDAISRRGSTAAAPDTTTVVFPDLYHELQGPPPRLDLDGIIARPPDTLYYNPALAIVAEEGTDNPYDVDWLRFEVPPDPQNDFARRVTIRTTVRPFGASDSSDVSLVVTDASARVEARSSGVASEETVTAMLDPGTHYLIVQDVAGIPTRYAVRVAEGITCDF